MAKSALFKSFGMSGGASKGGNLFTLINSNKSFLIKIFANLIVQLGITYYVMTNTSQIDPSYKWPLIISTFILLFITILNFPIWVKLIAFTLFSICFGKLFTIYKKKYGEEAINLAVLGALSVFGLMFAVGVAISAFGIVLGGTFGLFLFIALLTLIIFKLLSIFGSNLAPAKKTLYGAGIGIFGLYVLYDTNNILKRASYYDGDFITASMDYYLDIINLFSSTLGYENN
jgi:FtsH-binding integral membrane protein